ncbi:sulfotransferase [Sphingomonas daechungensis]|uniref:sulfotransferase n=1 Tax=Sphingomonas daechungensis TaxID=1176646 RepID=UPI0037843976
MKADYGIVDRLLHRVALGEATAGVFHEVERGRYLEGAPKDEGGHVFVTGLARAGTTILLRELYATGQFGSLLYADMPFVLAPNLWAGVSKGARKPFEAVERGHGDGIVIDLESPEAFDEVFWRLACGKDYIRPNCLLPHRPDRKIIARYRDYIRLVLRRRNRTHYLSKDNNNILRLGALAAAMPDCTFLLVIREPAAHAGSLLRQHLRTLGDKDAFRLNYLRWLVHHEFGADHRPFRFPGSPDGDRTSLDYWLATWTACYSALETVVETNGNVLVVPYDRLCGDPQSWNAVAKTLGIAASDRQEIRTVSNECQPLRETKLSSEAQALYERYLRRAVT